jgi:hypothetical protein
MRPSIARQPIDQVYLAAARVGGIHANNSYPADFIHQNLVIEANLRSPASPAGGTSRKTSMKISIITGAMAALAWKNLSKVPQFFQRG